MNLTYLIQHPEEMNKESLFALRELIARHPYHQTARLLLLQNLYLLHDPTFDEELRRAAIYITDRKVLFQLVEAAHYRLKAEDKVPAADHKDKDDTKDGDRTATLIDKFLSNIPDEQEQRTQKSRKPTPADATIDYVAYLLELEEDEKEQANAPTMKGQNLIDDFINVSKGNFDLKDELEFLPANEDKSDVGEDAEEGFFTETLARIYIKQGRYSKALEIIQRLNLVYPKKNRYFADQIRFLEKLIQNSNKK